MKITDSARDIILEILRAKQLDPNNVFVQIQTLKDGMLAFNFTKDKVGKIKKFGELTVIIGYGTNVSDIVVDYGEVNNRRGIIFLNKDDYVN